MSASEDDILKIREQAREFENKRFDLAMEKYADQLHEGRENARSYSNQYAQSVLRTVFLLNGGSIVALLTLIGSMFTKTEQTVLVAISLTNAMVPAFWLFAAGLFSACLSAAIAYLNLSWVADQYPTTGEIFDFIYSKPLGAVPPALRRKVSLSLYAGVLAAFASLFCFLGGAYCVLSALRVLGVQG